MGNCRTYTIGISLFQFTLGYTVKTCSLGLLTASHARKSSSLRQKGRRLRLLLFALRLLLPLRSCVSHTSSSKKHVCGKLGFANRFRRRGSRVVQKVRFSFLKLSVYGVTFDSLRKTLFPEMFLSGQISGQVY